MSGICGLAQFNGQAADLALLQAMTASLAFRGPDAQRTWAEACVGFGHTLLLTNEDAAHEQQPATLDGQVWIVADARIDGWAELKAELATAGRNVAGEATDADLILHAYHAWGEDCARHLVGDFAFAIWDGQERKLFCARDHFGVKLFFYAASDGSVAFSNTLNCLRRHPIASDRLDDLAIADFLLFERFQDPGATAFADIRRLPPAHALTVSAQGIRVERYWQLTSGEVHYRKGDDYVERFVELLESAVRDRLRTRRVGIEMSGGLDSTSVAAVAKAVLDRGGKPFEINAYSFVYERLIRSDERHFADLAAGALGIPLHHFVVDDYRLYQGFDDGRIRPPEPAHEPLLAIVFDGARLASRYARVFLTGWDGDALLSESPKPFLRSLWQAGKVGAAVAGALQYALAERRLPERWRSWLSGQTTESPFPEDRYPAWLNPELVERLGLEARWQSFSSAPPTAHPVRPNAHGSYGLILGLSSFFDFCDPGVTGAPVEYRHPLMDVRLVDYCLSLPPLPWCIRKRMLREAMRGRLPEAVRTRPKTPLAGWPALELLGHPGCGWVNDFVVSPGLSRYLERHKLPRICPDITGSPGLWADMRPLSLNLWLAGHAADRSRCQEM